MTEWLSLHQHHTAARTRLIRDRALFSDVLVEVEGCSFHCHRYVLAQASRYFFTRFVPTLPASSSAAFDGQTELVLAASKRGDRNRASISEDNFSTSSRLKTGDASSPIDTKLHKSSEVKFGDSVQRSHTGFSVSVSCTAELASDHSSIKSPSEVSQHTKNCDEKQVFEAVDLTERGPRPGDEYKLTENPLTGSFSGYHKDSISSTTTRDSGLDSDIAVLDVNANSSTSFNPLGSASVSSQSEFDSPQNITVVTLNFLTAKTFSSILDFLYHGQDCVTLSNVVPIFKGSSRLEISSLAEQCQLFIVEGLYSRKLNASLILQDPHMAENAAISQAALDVLLTDFAPDSSQKDWFLALSVDKLHALLSDHRLNVRNEDEVFHALLTWYRHDPRSRHAWLAESLAVLRLTNLSPLVLVEQLVPLLTRLGSQEDRSDVSLTWLVQRALAYHLMPDRRHDEVLPSALFRPSQASERVLLVLGNQSDQLYGFSFARRAWFKLAPPPQTLGLGVAACSHGDDLYVSGGDKAMKKCWRYRSLTNKWKQEGELNVGRRSHCTACVGDRLFVVGGKNDSHNNQKDTLDSVEVLYLKDKGQGWRLLTMASLRVPVRSMAWAVVEEKIFLFGGRTSGYMQNVDVIQCLDTRTLQASIVGHLPAPSCLARTLIVHKVVYVLETSGDILRFQTQNAGGQTSAPGSAEAVYHAAKIPSSSSSLATVQLPLLKVDELQNYADLTSKAVLKVGQVQGLGWQWFGVAHGQADRIIYIVGGEIPGDLQSSLVVPDAKASPDSGCDLGSPSLSVTTEEEELLFKEVRFLQPEKMTMCYVTSYMSVAKEFLVEKLA